MGNENFISSGRISSTFFSANGLGAYLLPVIGLVAHFLYTAISPEQVLDLGRSIGPFSGTYCLPVYAGHIPEVHGSDIWSFCL